MPEYRRPSPGGQAPRNTPAHPAQAEPMPSPSQDDRTRIQGAVGGGAAANGNGGAPQGEKPAKAKKEVKGKLKVGTIIGVMILNVIKALFVLLCVGLIAGSIVAVQVVQYVVEATENDEELLDLQNMPLAQTSYFMIKNPDNPNAEAENDYIEYQQLVGEENRTWVDYDQIPQDMINAVIATEDREFETHHGVNFRRTTAALVNEIMPVEGMRGGASTITQQLVKNISGDDDTDGTAGYLRKLREIFRAWGLENRYTKQTIMEAYLNTFGLSGRIAGVEAAAQTYFGKTSSELLLHECAMIAGITQAPTRYSPYLNPENCLKRRNDVIYFMEQAGFITQQQAEEVYAMNSLGLVTRESDVNNSAASAGIFSYLSDKAYDDVIADLMKQKGYTKNEARAYLYNGGLRIYLTGDLNVQSSVDNIMATGYDEGGYFMNEEKFPGYRSKLTQQVPVKNDAGVQVDTQYVLPQGAVVVIDYDGALIATSGGIGQKETSLSLNRSIGTLQRDASGQLIYNSYGEPIVQGTLRQVGSTMKPISAYALGIDYGIITYSRMVKDEPVMARDPNKRDAEGRQVKDWPQNYANKGGKGTPVMIAGAIAESYNTVAAQVGMWVGREAMFEYLRDTLQVTSLLDPQDMDLAPLVLGAQTYGMSLYELAGAYMPFGGNDTYGMFNTLHSYTRVEDTRGNIVMEPELTSMQAIDPETGFVMNKLLENVLSTSRVGGGTPTAGGMTPVDAEGNKIAAVAKTGTTSSDNDRLFVGLTPDYVTAVWWGYDQGNELTFEGKWSPGARTNIPVNVWKTLTEDIYQNISYLDPTKQFPDMPDGVIETKACTSSGELARAGCPTMTAWYTSFGPQVECPGHRSAEEDPAAEPPPA